MKILNFGSINIDHVYQVDRFVTPGETISSLSLQHFCGGKGLNQSISLAKAGANVYHAGIIGNDGDILRQELVKNNVNVDYLSKYDGVNGHAIIEVNKEGQNCIITYGGSNQMITEKYVDEVLSNFAQGDIVLMQNEINCIEYIARKAYKKGIKIALNPSPITGKLLSDFPFEYVSWLILNEVEGYELTGKKDENEIIKCLSEKYPHTEFILTLGKKGVVYKSGSVTLAHGIYEIPVVDTTGAGDTFTGYFLACISSGMDAETALRKASVASSLSVSKKGASSSIPLMSEVEKAEKTLKSIQL